MRSESRVGYSASKYFNIRILLKLGSGTQFSTINISFILSNIFLNLMKMEEQKRVSRF